MPATRPLQILLPKLARDAERTATRCLGLGLFGLVVDCRWHHGIGAGAAPAPRAGHSGGVVVGGLRLRRSATLRTRLLQQPLGRSRPGRWHGHQPAAGIQARRARGALRGRVMGMYAITAGGTGGLGRRAGALTSSGVTQAIALAGFSLALVRRWRPGAWEHCGVKQRESLD